ncbi:MAG: gamma-glutamylcyclotransferase family protein [Planctomycetia bacterium]
MAECRLFVYGLLQSGKRPPATTSAAVADAVRGDLYDLGPYPTAVRVGDPAADWIEGETLTIDDAELPALDEFEDVAGGLYRRLRTTTRNGLTAWVYEYLPLIPPDLQPQRRWRG